jgi:hypothetical protein
MVVVVMLALGCERSSNTVIVYISTAPAYIGAEVELNGVVVGRIEPIVPDARDKEQPGVSGGTCVLVAKHGSNIITIKKAGRLPVTFAKTYVTENEDYLGVP